MLISYQQLLQFKTTTDNLDSHSCYDETSLKLFAMV